MKRTLFAVTIYLLTISIGFADSPSVTKGFIDGTPAIKSISTISFGPEGILFVGDSRGGAVFAIDVNDKTPIRSDQAINIDDIEGKIAKMLGTTEDQILIHDLAVNPISQNVYLSVSRGNRNAIAVWKLANDVTDAAVLLRVSPKGSIEEVTLANIKYSKINLPNPISDSKGETYRGSSLRVDAITDLAYSDGKLFVAGLSNEEFASTLRIIPFPFDEKVSSTSVEVYHAAHGRYETNAPIRTLLPYTLNDSDQLLAAYTCTPLVSMPVSEMKNGKHIRAKTLSEMGSGNIPLDMISYENAGKKYILISNTTRSLVRIDPVDIQNQSVGLTERVSGGNIAGVKITPRPGIGIQQMDNLNDKYIIALQRMPNGKLNLNSLEKRWL